MSLRDNILTLPTRLKFAAGVITRRSCVHWGGETWLDVRALLGDRDRPVIFDVGANLGQTAREIRRWIPRADVHCYEPVLDTFRVLQSKATHATVHNLGLSCTVGVARMKTKEFSTNLARVHQEGEPEEPTDITVNMSTVDAEMRKLNIDRLDVLKIDVEGHELDVLSGARRTLETGCVDLVLAECRVGSSGLDFHAPIEAILEILEPLEFRFIAYYTRMVRSGIGVNHGDALFARQTCKVPRYRTGPLM